MRTMHKSAATLLGGILLMSGCGGGGGDGPPPIALFTGSEVPVSASSARTCASRACRASGASFSKMNCRRNSSASCSTCAG